MRISRLIIALISSFVLASCVQKQETGRQTIQYVRDVLSGEYPQTKALLESATSSYKDDIAIVGTDHSTIPLFEAFKSYDSRDNIDARYIADELPDFAGEEFAIITQEESFKPYLDRSDIQGLRRQGVERVLSAVDTLANISLYDLEGEANKASSKMIIISDPYLYHHAAFDVDTLFRATSCNIPVIYPIDVMLNSAFETAHEKLNVALLYDPKLADAQLYVDILRSKSAASDCELGSFIVFPTDGEDAFFERLVTSFQASYGDEKIDLVLVDDYNIDISELKRQLADIVSVMNESSLTYGQAFADDVQIVGVIDECAIHCYDLLRAKNLFTHNISLPQATMFRVYPSGNALNDIVLIPELYVQN